MKETFEILFCIRLDALQNCVQLLFPQIDSYRVPRIMFVLFACGFSISLLLTIYSLQPARLFNEEPIAIVCNLRLYIDLMIFWDN